MSRCCWLVGLFYNILRSLGGNFHNNLPTLQRLLREGHWALAVWQWQPASRSGAGGLSSASVYFVTIISFVKRFQVVMALNKLSIDKLDLKDKRVLIRYVCQKLFSSFTARRRWPSGGGRTVESKRAIVPLHLYGVIYVEMRALHYFITVCGAILGVSSCCGAGYVQ